MENEIDTNNLDAMLNQHFAGRVVRKDLTKLVKEGANVPVYVLEYLLGMYCASADEEIIKDGLQTVKNILADNYVRPDEAEKVKSKIKELGNYKIIDKVTVKLNEKNDVYEAVLSNLGVRGIVVPSETVKRYEKLLAGGIWSIIDLEYFYEEGQRSSPFILKELKPIQMPNLDLEAVFEGRREFTEEQWIDVLLRSTGLEPTLFEERVKWHFVARLIPLVENNYNICELGPRGTGKSHVYKEISPNSILVSGGQTTVANLFYNMSTSKVGLVGMWDVVAFDEVAGIRFKDKDGVQIMKDFMASGSFSRGRDLISANASMVFVGNNLNQRDVIGVRRTVSGLLKLLYPHGDFDKDAVERCLKYALESRRRVKEQLKKIGGMEFYDVHFSYIDNESLEEMFVSVLEQGGDKLIPDGPLNPGTLHAVAMGTGSLLGLYRQELQVTSGNGKLTISGVGTHSKTKEAVKVAFDYFKANISRVSTTTKAGDHDYHLHMVELHNTGPASAMTLASFVTLCSGLMGKALQSQLVVLGDMSLGGSITPVENLAGTLQVAFDAGAKRILLPMSSVGDIATIPGELFAKFQTSFYSDPIDAVFKALGVE